MATKTDPMPSPLIDSPDALDAATAAARRARHDRLLRIAQGKGVRSRAGYACLAITAICAVVAFVEGGRLQALIIGTQTCLLIGFVFIGGKAARREALRKLQEMKRSP
jgi:hypothetical protein